jgi:hypothetical protein
MTGENKLTVNQEEMCRLLQIALAGDIIREGVGFSVVNVASAAPSYGSEKAFTITLTEPQRPEAQPVEVKP